MANSDHFEFSSNGQDNTTWGDLTSMFAGRDLGYHSADPSGDGYGWEDREGLANVIEQGNMQATVDFIEDAIF